MVSAIRAVQLINWSPLRAIQVERSQEGFIHQVQDIGVSVIGQSDQLVKADKLLRPT